MSETPRVADAATNRRGIALMLAAMAAYAVNDALVKATALALPPGQLLAVRGVFAAACIALAAGATGHPLWRGLQFHPMLALRCVLEIAAALSSVLALARAPLATVSAIMMFAPLIIVATSGALGWETRSFRRLALSLAGLAGVIGVVQPWTTGSAHGLDAGAGFAMLCALSLAGRDLVTRRLPVAIPSSSVTMLTTASVCAAGLLLGQNEQWGPLPASSTGFLFLAAVATAAGNHALISACRNADLSVVSPFRYSFVLWSVVLGALFWGEQPNFVATIGIALVASAGILARRTANGR